MCVYFGCTLFKSDIILYEAVILFVLLNILTFKVIVYFITIGNTKMVISGSEQRGGGGGTISHLGGDS